MTEQDFRRLALSLREVVEGAHMNHPDFRVSGRIFATLAGDGVSGMVKVEPDLQQQLVSEWPSAFVPETGAWGRQGCTRVDLASVDLDTLGGAMTRAWQLAVQGPPARRRARRRQP